MKIFISWSGETSHKVAVTLKEWLPIVIRTLEPWVSSVDISKGGRWSVEIAKQLDECNFGILCIDPSNYQSPWLNFEAGALSKSFADGRVAPFLIGLLPSDINGPISQFQMTTISEDDVGRLVESINQTMIENKIGVERLKKAISVCWPVLRDALSRIEIPSPKQSLKLSSIEEEILMTLVTNLNEQDRGWTSLGMLAKQIKVSKAQTIFLLAGLQAEGFLYKDNGGNPWIIKEGIAYLAENKLI